MAKPSKHQEDLPIDDAIRRTNPIAIAQLAKETGQSEARIRSRVKDDMMRERAIMLGDDLVRFNLSKIPNRTVKPFKSE